MKKFTTVLLIVMFCFSIMAPAFAAAAEQSQQKTTQPANDAINNPVPSDDPAEQEAAEKAQQEAEAKAAAELAEKMKVSEPGAAFQVLERCETIVYSQVQSGPLLPRLSRLEKDVFGRELPGSLTERQTALLRFLEEGTESSPSLLYKVAVSEWGTTKKIMPEYGLARRLDTVEIIIDGATTTGPIASRTERILGKILPENTSYVTATLPKGTVAKAKLLKALTVRTCKPGDKVILSLLNEIKQDDIIVAPAGSRLLATITKVKAPRSFGRGSVIEMKFDLLETIQPKQIPVGIGELAKKAEQVELTTVGAVGASFAGAILLGPLGLVTGAFIRGNDKQLKEGTVFFVETAEDSEVKGYKIPMSINSYAVTTDNQPSPQGSGATQPVETPVQQ